MMHRFARHGRNLIVTLTMLSLLACGGSTTNDSPLPVLNITTAPAVSTTAFANAPMAYQLTVSTSLNSDFIVTLTSPGHELEIFFNEPNVARVTNDYDLTLLGLRPGRTYDVSVTARTQDLLETTSPTTLQITTPDLPADFPVIMPLIPADTALMAPGYTLLNTRRKDGTAAYTVIVDDAGEVVWYTKPSGPVRTERVATGNLRVINEMDGQISEVDMRGDVQSAFLNTVNETLLAFHSNNSSNPLAGSIPIGAAQFHDAVAGGANVTNSYFVSTRNAPVSITDFPLNEDVMNKTTGTALVQDEPIVEFSLLDGSILQTYNFLEFLDDTRIGYDGTQGLPGGADWANVNEVILADGVSSLIASLRNQDAIVKFSRVKAANGDVLVQYILGPPEEWGAEFQEFLLNEPTDGSDFAWPYHQSSVQLVSEIGNVENLLIFDNGNRRATPFTGDAPVDATLNESRAIEYIINQSDPDDETIAQDWEWGPGESIYSPIAGDADRLDNGNTLITFGGICTEVDIPSDNVDICDSTARIIEINTVTTTDDPPVETNTKVFDLEVTGEPMSTGYIVDRSQRISSLYPNASTILTVQ